MMSTTRYAAILALVISATTSSAQEGYLTGKGTFTESLQITQLQGGFAGDTGWTYKIEKDGAWKKFSVFNKRMTLKAKGTLNAAERKALAAQFAVYGLRNLPAKTGKPTTNRQLLKVKYGKKTSQFIFGAGKLMPKANPKTVAGRFGGVFRSVMTLTKGKGGNDK